ncbi:MAG: hypothetical protein HY662_01345 [Chloroflexi bacterium]|nr:hypothetical protein [Chloroflexota bacterium]
MGSETLRNIRTMRQVKTSLDLARQQKARTTNSLSKTEEDIARQQQSDDRRIKQVLTKERRRFATQEASVERLRQRILRSREKLAATINKNRALTELRIKLQQTRWEEGNSKPAPAQSVSGKARRGLVELRY